LYVLGSFVTETSLLLVFVLDLHWRKYLFSCVQ